MKTRGSIFHYSDRGETRNGKRKRCISRSVYRAIPERARRIKYGERVGMALAPRRQAASQGTKGPSNGQGTDGSFRMPRSIFQRLSFVAFSLVRAARPPRKRELRGLSRLILKARQIKQSSFYIAYLRSAVCLVQPFNR